MEPTGIGNTNKGSTKEEARQHLQNQGNKISMKNKMVGGNGLMGLIGGGGLLTKIASRFLGKGSKLGKLISKTEDFTNATVED